MSSLRRFPSSINLFRVCGSDRLFKKLFSGSQQSLAKAHPLRHRPRHLLVQLPLHRLAVVVPLRPQRIHLGRELEVLLVLPHNRVDVDRCSDEGQVQ